MLLRKAYLLPYSCFFFLILIKVMVLYLIIQTIVLSIAAGFFVYGEYQSNEYLIKRRRDLYNNISYVILLIFLADVFAMFLFSIIPKE